MIKRQKGLTVGLDVDDVLAACNSACVEAKELFKITGWDCQVVLKYKHLFGDPAFVANQPVAPGAQAFVRQLLERGCEVVFVTSVPSSVAQARATWLQKHFPEVPKKNLVLTARKDLVEVDVLIDDNPHHIVSAKAKWPILMRKPWNQSITGLMSVNGFDEALSFIDAIIGERTKPIKKGKDIICLVGPSGSGKTDIVKAMQAAGCIVPRIHTTAVKTNSWYRTVSQEDFQKMMMEHRFLQTSSYGGEYYGISIADFAGIASIRTRAIVVPIDIGGAYAIKNRIGSGSAPEFSVTTIFIDRDKNELIEAILRKPLSDREKTLRILALDAEFKNAPLCDFTLSYNGNALEAAKEIMEVI